MRLIAALSLVLALAGCDQAGRYQLASAGTTADAVWKLDTATGDISICLRAPQTGAIKCYLWGK